MKTTQLIVNQKGFTLIELMVVAVILAIISAIAVPIYTGYKEEAETQEAYATLDQVAGVCINKAIKSLETGSSTTSFTLTPPADGKYFKYSGATCTTTAGTFTATGSTGTAVAGKTLVVAVSFTASASGILSTPVKTWSGTLY